MPDKTCTSCGATHPATLEYFYQNLKCRYGVTTKCKACLQAAQNAPVDELTPLPDIIEQRCKKCGQVLAISHFSTFKAAGHLYYRKTCRDCIYMREEAKRPKYKKRHHRKHRKQDNEYSRQYYQTHREEILMQKKRKKLERYMGVTNETLH